METALIPRTTVTEVCAHRDAAMTMMRDAVAAMVQGQALAEQSYRHAQQAHGAATFTLSDRSRSEAYKRLFEGIDPEKSFEAYRQQVDARVWMNLLCLTGMEHMMDRTAKDELYDQLCNDVPEVSEDTIYATFDGLRKDAYLIFQRGLARAFIDLDRRFRSHDAFKIGARIILTNVFNERGNWGHYSMRDTICDVERVFAVLDGNKPDPRGLINAIDEGRGRNLNPRQSCTESEYFRIRTYMNGNAHLWFTRDDLVGKANGVLADYYGEVLPDGVPADVTDKDIRERSTVLCKDLGFYPTPEAVVEKLLSDLYINEGSRVLEPSAGTGNIVRHLLKTGAGVDAVEVDAGRVLVLQELSRAHKRLTVLHANFLRMIPVPAYSHVVMNPPFHGTLYMQHVLLGFEFLRPGGKLVAILPATVEFGESKAHDTFRAWAKKHSDCYGSPFRDLPMESFASSGTRINTVYVVLHK